MNFEEFHEPVLLREAVTLLVPASGKIFVDATLGGGGHSEAFLEAGAQVIAFDQDPAAITFAEKKLAHFGNRFRAVHANFSQSAEVLDRLGVSEIDGAFLDIGVSSHQLESAERGFSFMHDGPLDMRMNPQGSSTAADLVNTASGEQLERIFRSLGEEPNARRITVHLLRERVKRPFSRTLELAAAVEAVSPRRGKTHPATRVFQALRMSVNRELEVLGDVLEQLTTRLRSGGRLGVISFHSLEDRIVKTFFKSRATPWIDRPEWAERRPNPAYVFEAITRKPVIPNEAEQSRNPRSRSAKLRVVEKI